MKVAVTGATGHLGGLIVREIYKHNHDIKILTRQNPNDIFDNIPVEIVTGDLDNQNALNNLMASCDALIHAAGVISIKGDPKGEVHKTNVEGTRNVMETARQSGIKRIIHISSIHAYRQQPKFEILDEHRQKASDNSFAYDRSKREGEEIALSFASATMDVLVMNPTSFISPFDFKPSKTGQFIIDLYTGKLPFLFTGGFDFCDGRDVAHAIVNGLTMGKNGESYLLSGNWHSLKDIAGFLSHSSGKIIRTIILPIFTGWLFLPAIYLYARIRKSEPMYTNEALVAINDGNRKISSAKAERELKFSKRPLEETIKDTYDWFLKNGYLE